MLNTLLANKYKYRKNFYNILNFLRYNMIYDLYYDIGFNNINCYFINMWL